MDFGKSKQKFLIKYFPSQDRGNKRWILCNCLSKQCQCETLHQMKQIHLYRQQKLVIIFTLLRFSDWQAAALAQLCSRTAFGGYKAQRTAEHSCC